MNNIRSFAKKVCSYDIGKYLLINLIMTLFLNLYLELTLRKSLQSLMAFIRDRTFLFFFNGFLVFTSLSVVLLFRKKIFAYAFAGGSWILVGLANGLILSNRKTPFTAVDLTIAQSALPIIRSYLTLPQIILMVCLVVLVIVCLVCLFLYTREQKRHYDGGASFFWVAVICLAFVALLKVGTARGILARKFDNLIDAYQDYGVAYSFFVTAVDTGIDRPLNYSEISIGKLLKKSDKKVRSKMAKDRNAGEEGREPNIIFVQLESFFDPSVLKDLEISEDPLPNLHRLQKNYTHGYLKVPVYGAGTINTEFEVLTGMNLDDFGSGEYPFRSILHKRTSDNIGYWLGEKGYASTVIHNNNASFYDRDKVYSNLGFQNFISIENMNITDRNEIGWPKDYVLEDQILDTLRTTKEKDLIYTISVQGHGDYPETDRPEDEKKWISGDMDEKTLNAWNYYGQQIYEMDDFIGRLVKSLSAYPEDVILVVYGDHLPGMNIESEDLKEGSKYQTPYIIWDNFGYNTDHASDESGTVRAWQLAAKVLGQVKIYDGVLNRYHQTMQKTKHYKKNLRLLEYDMLYGSNFVRSLKGKGDLEPSEIRYGIHNPRITGLVKDETSGDYIIKGAYFTDYSRVYADHILIRSRKLSDTLLLIPAGSLGKQKELTVSQVSAVNKKILYNGSEPLAIDWENLETLSEDDPVRALLNGEEGAAETDK